MGWQENLTNIWASIRSKNRYTLGTVENNIIKSEEDRRDYRGLTLTNGLRILLISDPSTSKAAAALDVNVGHLADPDEVPGLAHLCEHMLFMGTKRFKDVDEYKQFLSEHGGSSNAFTSMEHTNYHFEIAADHFQEALKRFSQFVRQPQFESRVIEREILVVNAENEKNISNDQWRLFQLSKSTSDPSHPYNKFGTGNKDTLLTNPKNRGINVYKRLLNFHKRFYSSNMMCLVVLGKESLDDLEAAVVPLFIDVRDNSVEPMAFDKGPYRPEDMKVQLRVVPLKNMENMLLTFPIDDLMPLYKIKPGHYIGYLMSFQGRGSLFAELKERGWVNQLVAANKLGARGFMFFCVSMDLTEEGFNNTDTIISLVFQYVNMLKQNGVTERMYDECSAFKALRFRFKEKETPRDYVSDCAEILHLFPFRDVLCGPWLLFEYSEKEILSLLDKINPDNIRVLVQSKRFSGETDLVERWYGTEYSLHQIPSQTIKEWHEVNSTVEFHLPPVNEFIPTDLQLVTRDKQSGRYPALLHESVGARLWYVQDDHYLLPKTSITVLLTSPGAYQSAEDVAELEMGMEVLSDHLQPLCQPAEWAGLFFDVFSTPNGITLALHGYSDKLDILLERTVQSLALFRVDVNRYVPIKEKYLQALSNFDMKQPHNQATHLVNCVTSQLAWTKADILTAARGVSANMVQDCLDNFLSEVHMEMLVYGNVTQKTALGYLEVISNILTKETGMKPITKEKHRLRLRELQLEKGNTLYKHLSTAPRDTSGVTVYLQCGQQATRVNVLLELFFHLTHQHCYDVLRTRDQLGYVVLYNVRRSKGIHGLRIAVQSHYPASYIYTKILAFISELESYLAGISPERFLNQRAVLKSLRQERPKRMGEQNARYWTEISTNLYQFNRDETEAEEVATITQEDVQQFYKDFIAPGGSHQRTLIVQVTPASAAGSEQAVTSQIMEINGLDEFKQSLSAYPPAEPALPVSYNNYRLQDMSPTAENASSTTTAT